EVIGPNGNLILPMFTYSFGQDKEDKIFNPSLRAPGMCPIGNWLLLKGEGDRSLDPMLSVLCYGNEQSHLAAFDDDHCFGVKSIWAKLYETDAMICNLNFDSGSTYLHWVEKKLNVSYRQDISLSGHIKLKNQTYSATVTYTGRDLGAADTEANFVDYHDLCVNTGKSTITPLGRGTIVSQSCRDAEALLARTLPQEPFLLTTRYRKKMLAS
ncbi:AAC(3) family N-acetyltransferase, partial [Alphaproteobacteria bacterium]|nr:AAC(3) family N-acetyltransferase [Alphaproteobacteria bacterium]